MKHTIKPGERARSAPETRTFGVRLDAATMAEIEPTTAAEERPPDGMVRSVFHLLKPDINQEIYEKPEYPAALSSAWLSEPSTLFRHRY